MRSSIQGMVPICLPIYIYLDLGQRCVLRGIQTQTNNCLHSQIQYNDLFENGRFFVEIRWPDIYTYIYQDENRWNYPSRTAMHVHFMGFSRPAADCRSPCTGQNLEFSPSPTLPLNIFSAITKKIYNLFRYHPMSVLGWSYGHHESFWGPATSTVK